MGPNELLLRPSARNVIIVPMMWLVAIAVIVFCVVQRTWTQPSQIPGWIISIGFFAGMPMVFLHRTGLAIDSRLIVMRNYLGPRTTVERSRVKAIAHGPSGVFLVDQNGARLLNIRPVWSKDQLASLAQLLQVPIENSGQWRRRRNPWDSTPSPD